MNKLLKSELIEIVDGIVNFAELLLLVPVICLSAVIPQLFVWDWDENFMASYAAYKGRRVIWRWRFAKFGVFWLRKEKGR